MPSDRMPLVFGKYKFLPKEAKSLELMAMLTKQKYKVISWLVVIGGLFFCIYRFVGKGQTACNMNVGWNILQARTGSTSWLLKYGFWVLHDKSVDLESGGQLRCSNGKVKY